MLVSGAPYQPPGPREFGYGDYVKIELDAWLQRSSQEGKSHREMLELLPVSASMHGNHEIHMLMYVWSCLSNPGHQSSGDDSERV